jgi:hypothetical protein
MFDLLIQNQQLQAYQSIVDPTIINQYANSPALLAIAKSFATALDESANVSDFYNMVWNIQTAQGFGLDIWGRIVGVNRILRIPGGINYVGFNPYYATFGFGILYNGQQYTQAYPLTDANFRILIMAKAMANIINTSPISINKLLQLLFPGQPAHVVDQGAMVMIYSFNFSMTTIQKAIVTESGVLPHTSGVATFAAFGNIFNTIGFNPYGNAFGFAPLFDATSLVRIA